MCFEIWLILDGGWYLRSVLEPHGKARGRDCVTWDKYTTISQLLQAGAIPASLCLTRRLERCVP